MTGGVECVGENETVLDAAKKMDSLGVGALPVCGDDERLKGMITCRDIVVKVLAQNKDPASTKAGELGQGKPVTIGADDDLQELVRTMRSTRSSDCPSSTGTSWSEWSAKPTWPSTLAPSSSPRSFAAASTPRSDQPPI